MKKMNKETSYLDKLKYIKFYILRRDKYEFSYIFSKSTSGSSSRF